MCAPKTRCKVTKRNFSFPIQQEIKKGRLYLHSRGYSQGYHKGNGLERCLTRFNAARCGVNNCFAVGKERPTAATPNPRALADAAPIGRCDRPRRCARRPARGSSTLVPMDLMPRAAAPAPRRQPLPAPGSRRFGLPVGPLCLTRSASRCAIIAGCRHSPLQS